MELEYIQKNITGDFEEVRRKIVASVPDKPIKDYLAQYEPSKHKVADPALRPDKLITVKTIIDGKEAEVTKKVDVTRVPIAWQKKIVRFAATCLCGNPIQLIADPKDEKEKKVLELVQRVWDDNKLDYESKELVKILMSETECAELWYSEVAGPDDWKGTANEGKKVRFRMKVLSYKKGDRLYPVFNSRGDMIAFGRAYSVRDDDGKDIDHFDLYTDDTIYLSTKNSSGWETETEKNQVGKIPVIFYSKDTPEWSDAQWAIERHELSVSNHGDTNDYNGSPILKATGKINGFSAKGEAGKIVEMDAGADLDYVSWDHADASIVAEQKNLRAIIHETTDTPDLTPEHMKGLGPQSGVALKMLFLPAHMKASDNEEPFGKGIQRRINFLKTAVTKINSDLQPSATISIKPKFEYFIPKDEAGMIDMLNVAVTGKIMSQKTAVSLNPLVVDPEKEYEQLQAEGLNDEMNDDEQ